MIEPASEAYVKGYKSEKLKGISIWVPWIIDYFFDCNKDMLGDLNMFGESFTFELAMDL